MESIKLKKSSIIKIGIQDEEGNDTGNHLEFDLEDLTLPTRAQESLEMHKKNVRELKTQQLLINKKQDKKGKKLLSANEEALIKAVQEFYEKEIIAQDLFLGEGGTKKILNGRRPYLTMFDDIQEYLEPLMPIFQQREQSINEKIKQIQNKYSNNKSDVIE